MSVELTAEQKEFLAQLETEFADRYTENDPDYSKAVNSDIKPPVVHPWYSHARRNFDWADRRGRGRDRHGRDRWRGNHHNHHRRDDHHHHRPNPYNRYR